MARVKVGHFTQDGGLIYIPIGFIPSFIRMADRVGVAIYYEWWSAMEQDEVSGKQEGISDTAGTKAALADAGGIVEYDAGTELPTISDYTLSASSASTARTATADGTFLRPSTSGTIKDGSAADRSLIFECVIAGTGSAEPPWPTAVGEQVVDGTVTFELVVEPTERRGYQGVRVSASIQNDGNEMYYLAILADTDLDHGDVDSWTDGIAPETP